MVSSWKVLHTCKEKFMVSRSVLSCSHLPEMVGMDSDSVFLFFCFFKTKDYKADQGN